MRRKILYFGFVALCLITILIWSAVFSVRTVSGKTLFDVMDVGQGDALFIQAENGTLKFSEFKPALAKIIADHFAPFRERRAALVKDTKFVDNVIAEGNTKASLAAEATLLEVQTKMGLR